jgi:site-specific DNA-methyltransferase (adenine-specific)
MKLSNLKLNPTNPRIIKDDKFKKLVQSLKDFPEMMEKRPMVCVTDVDGKIFPIGGNMRLKALRELGMKEIPDSWVVLADDWTEEQRKEFTIRDNVGFGEWNWEDLQENWDSEQLADWGLDVINFGTGAEVLEAEEDDFDTTPPEEPKTVLGDLYEIGEHRLLCGDSTITDSYLKLMDGELGDMVLTDPPYNVGYVGKTKEAMTIKNDSMSGDDFYTFLYDFYTALSTATKKGGAIYVWHASSEIINFAKAMVDAGWLLKQQLIWVKNSMVMGRQDYQWKHEPCLYGWLDGGSHNWYGDRKQSTVIEWDKPLRNGEHPTMKPVGLFAYQIQNSSKAGDIIIDAFGGSGTTMVASHQLGRRCYTMELDPKYCDVIVKRMIKLDPDLRIKRNGVDITNEWNI